MVLSIEPFINWAECMTAAPDVHKLSELVSVFILSCEMTEPWRICFFVYLFTDRCMQSWNAALIFFLLAILCGEKKRFRVRALHFTVPLGSGRIGSDDLRYGPGFSLKPLQTSTYNSELASSVVRSQSCSKRYLGYSRLSVQMASWYFPEKALQETREARRGCCQTGTALGQCARTWCASFSVNADTWSITPASFL